MIHFGIPKSCKISKKSCKYNEIVWNGWIWYIFWCFILWNTSVIHWKCDKISMVFNPNDFKYAGVNIGYFSVSIYHKSNEFTCMLLYIPVFQKRLRFHIPVSTWHSSAICIISCKTKHTTFSPVFLENTGIFKLVYLFSLRLV